MSAGGKFGNKGGGNKNPADGNIRKFKVVAWSKIVERVTHKDKITAEKWLDVYIPMFANRLMPQTIEGNNDDGSINIKHIILSCDSNTEKTNSE